MNEGRLPDFLVIGTMKSATTSLFRWLDAHPGTAMPEVKEPDFFADDRHWARGRCWYASLFPDAPGLTGEASVSSTDPEWSEAAAARIHEVVPGAPLVCVVRDPVARARSHFLHEVRRARERRPWPAALTSTSRYVTRSCYHRALAPHIARHGDGLLVVTFEALTGEDDTAWQQVLHHVGLEAHPRPATAANRADEAVRYTTAMRHLHDRGQLRHLGRLPGPVRRIGRRLLVRDAATTGPLEASATAEPPQELLSTWAREAAELAGALGWDEVPWPSVTGPGPAGR